MPAARSTAVKTSWERQNRRAETFTADGLAAEPQGVKGQGGGRPESSTVENRKFLPS